MGNKDTGFYLKQCAISAFLLLLISLTVDYLYIKNGQLELVPVLIALIIGALILVIMIKVNIDIPPISFPLVVALNILVYIINYWATAEYNGYCQMLFTAVYIVLIEKQCYVSRTGKDLHRGILAVTLALSIFLAFNAEKKAGFVYLLITLIYLIIRYRRNGLKTYWFASISVGILGVVGKVIYDFASGNQYWIIRLLDRGTDNPIFQQQEAAKGILSSGVGLFSKTNKTDIYDQLPDGYSEYILTFIAGTVGIIGCIIFICIIIYLIWNLAKLSQRFKTGYAKNIVLIFCFICTFRLVYSIFMCLGIFPVTSVTLPFLSYNIESFGFDCIIGGTIFNNYKRGKKND